MLVIISFILMILMNGLAVLHCKEKLDVDHP